jgi:hypothetical protein
LADRYSGGQLTKDETAGWLRDRLPWFRLAAANGPTLWLDLRGHL